MTPPVTHFCVSSDNSSFGYHSSSSFTASEEDSFYDSDMSIPFRTGVLGIHKHDVKRMRQFLKHDLRQHSYQPVTVRQFVTKVWGLDEAIFNTLICQDIPLPSDSVRSYKSIIQDSHSKETDLHEPFRKISDYLLQTVCNILHKGSTNLRTAFWDGKGTKRLESEFTSLKPDLLNVFLPVPPEITWKTTKSPLEFKRKGPISISENPSAPSASGTLQSGKVPPQSGQISGNSLQLLHLGSSTSAQENPHSGQKRSREDPDSDSTRDRKRLRVDLTEEELQLGCYALECFGCSSRHYVTGILVEGTSVSLWYYDRVAIFRTHTFNFDEAINGARLLTIALYALDQADMKHSGFDPHVYQFFPPSNPTTFVTKACIKTLERPPLENEMLALCFHFPLIKPSQIDYVFQIHEILSKYRAIVGRGTFVAAVQVYEMGKSIRRDHHVIKTSWQYKSRKSEGNILAFLRKAIPAWAKCLPDPLFHTTYTGAQLNIPRSEIQLLEMDTSKPIRDRDMHILVSRRYKNLWEADNVEEFKKIFLDCVECHYHVYNSGNVLHRDISDSNLMIWRPINEVKTEPEDEEVGVSQTITNATIENITQESCGILNDFDMAVVVNEEGPTEEDRGSHRTGTLQFMAVDLLNRRVTSDHFYRHDLESFFYILVWAATHYRLGHNQHQQRVETPIVLQPWINDQHARADKLRFIYEPLTEEDEIYDSVDDQFKGLWTDWIFPLHKMFKTAFRYAGDKKEAGAEYDIETINSHITFEKFMAAIGETSRGLIPQGHEEAGRV